MRIEPEYDFAGISTSTHRFPNRYLFDSVLVKALLSRIAIFVDRLGTHWLGLPESTRLGRHLTNVVEVLHGILVTLNRVGCQSLAHVVEREKRRRVGFACPVRQLILDVGPVLELGGRHRQGLRRGRQVPRIAACATTTTTTSTAIAASNLLTLRATVDSTTADGDCAVGIDTGTASSQCLVDRSTRSIGADAENVSTEPEFAARAVPLPPSPKPAWSHAKLGFDLSL